MFSNSNRNYIYLSILSGSLVSSFFLLFLYFKRRKSTNLIRIAKNHNQRSLRDLSVIGESWNSKITSIYEDKCVGSILALTCGDILGSALEGEHPKDINKYGTIHSFPRNKKRYTDDTEMTLALMKSINKLGYLSAKDCSERYGAHYLARPSRGYGRSAQQILKALALKQTTHNQSGRLITNDGSWANGGAMRITPVALCFRNAPLPLLLTAVKAAIMCTHIHPIAIDGALMQSLLVSYCVKTNVEEFNVNIIYNHLYECSQTDEIKEKLQTTINDINNNINNIEFAEKLCPNNHKNIPFQIRASDCFVSVFFIVCKYYKNPEEAIQQAISLGGDTDTIACMVGACVGGLHGTKWIPQRWFKNIENSKDHGRDVLIKEALLLSNYDFTSTNNIILEEDE